MEEQKKQICPVCGCAIGSNAYEKEGVTYCCEPCATNGVCECGCCTETKTTKKPSGRTEVGRQ